MLSSFSSLRLLVALLLASSVHIFSARCAYGQAAIQAFTSRPFVTGITPVIGSNGGVGGVSVDADGVVSRMDVSETKDLRDAWLKAHQPIANEFAQPTPLRMISLAALDRALSDSIKSGKGLSEEMFYLAGVQRVQYVFAVPDRNDVVLAGPAAGWQANKEGEVVSDPGGMPILRLDDLVDALRAAHASRDTGISCSIEPTEEGLKRFARLKSRRLQFNKSTIRAMEQAIGPQQVIIEGIRSSSHFSRVMVAADYMMKRLAMGFEASPVDQMPSYMELLQENSAATQVTSPRWWMTTNYQPLLRSPDRLAWQIRGQGVKTLTEDGILNHRGERQVLRADNRLSQQWADTMTGRFDELSNELSVFGQMRNCIDLAVVAALIANEGLFTVTDCQLEVLMDESRMKTSEFLAPTSVPSTASLVRGKRGWIVSVSGGVEINAWAVVEDVQVDAGLQQIHAKSIEAGSEPRWWW